MTQLASDDFNRADSATLGANWDQLGGSGNDHWTIVSNHTEPARPSINDALEFYDGGVTWPNDQYSQGTIGGSGGSPGTAIGPGLAVRGSTGGNWYSTLWSVGAASGGVAIFKVVTGVYTQLGANDASAATAGDIARTEVSGTTISIYRNGGLLTTRTDSALTAGKPGLWYSAAIATVSIDDWSGGDLITGAPTVISDFSQFPKVILRR